MWSAVVHRSAGSGETLRVLGDRISIMGRLEPSGMVVALLDIPPGSGVPYHRHASPEVFQILEGLLEMSAEDPAGDLAVIRAGAGDFVSVPANAPHGYRNGGTAPVRAVVTFDRAMERFFRAVNAIDAPAGPPSQATVARVLALAAEHGVVMLEGPPSR